MAVRAWLLKQPVFTSRILPAIPRPARWALRKAYFAPVEWIDRRGSGVGAPVPPRTKVFTGSVEGFERSGVRLVERLVELAALRPDSRILDIGSGMGRLAVALIPYLDEEGSYEGLDVVPDGIAWCTENITTSFPNVHFTLADVFNKEYNPGGHFQPSEYRFPYEDDSFDLVVLISVFTHMLPPDMTHYVEEISRVLRPGGRCAATYFLVNDESTELMRSGASSLKFNHQRRDYWTVSTRIPELSIGYGEHYVRHLFGTNGLFSAFEIHYGGWCGREPLWSNESGLGDQDLVVAVR
jgi:SAM-dependent methyltransferase